MNKPADWVIRIETKRELFAFFMNPEYKCPKCHQYIPYEGESMLYMVMDLICDKCPYCGTYIVVQKKEGVIEGYAEFVDAERRAEELQRLRLNPC